MLQPHSHRLCSAQPDLSSLGRGSMEILFPLLTSAFLCPFSKCTALVHTHTHTRTHTHNIVVQKAHCTLDTGVRVGGLGEVKGAHAFFTALIPRSASMVHAGLPGDRAAA